MKFNCRYVDGVQSRLSDKDKRKRVLESLIFIASSNALSLSEVRECFEYALRYMEHYNAVTLNDINTELIGL